jgi:hypothetical protein
MEKLSSNPRAFEMITCMSQVHFATAKGLTGQKQVFTHRPSKTKLEVLQGTDRFAGCWLWRNVVLTPTKHFRMRWTEAGAESSIAA